MPKKKVISVNIDVSIYEKLKERAKKEERSVSYLVNKILEKESKK